MNHELADQLGADPLNGSVESSGCGDMCHISVIIPRVLSELMAKQPDFTTEEHGCGPSSDDGA